ncbi:MAG: sulfocyanin-like copper-binding protein [Gemmatimonadales bacterium]
MGSIEMTEQMKRRIRAVMVPALLVPALAGVALAQAPAALRIDPTWLKVDSAASSAEFSLIAGLGGTNGGMNFNGATNGALTLVVPVGWHVVLNFRNDDPNMPHSAVVIPAVTPVPAGAGRPAFAGAATRQPDQGLATGSRQSLRFDAATAGSYMIFCAVPGHGMAGMWMRLDVSASAARPSIGPTPAGQ